MYRITRVSLFISLLVCTVIRPLGAQTITPATGGTNISADTVSGVYATLAGPAYAEDSSGQVGLGDIILKAPPGFQFDTVAGPSVRVIRLTGSGSTTRNINGAMSGALVPVTVTPSNITLNISVQSSGGVTCSLEWENVRVRPIAGTPLVRGQITHEGDSVLAGTTNGVTEWGELREIAGAAARLGISRQPSSNAIAGLAFAAQPQVSILDQFGNIRHATNGIGDNSAIVTVARGQGTGTLQGLLTATAANGIATYNNLSHQVATTITLNFTSPGLASTASTAIAVAPATATRMIFTTQPAGATAGQPFSVQPIVRSVDVFGNFSTSALPASLIATAALSQGTGTLLGENEMNIGTSAGRGTATYTNLAIDLAGTGKRITVTAPGLESIISAAFDVTAAGIQTQNITFASIPNKTYGDAAFALSATASSGLPVSFSVVSGPISVSNDTVHILGAGSATVRASQSGNASYSAAPNVDRSFVISKAALSVTASNASRFYGATNPIFTGTLDGVRYQDNITATFSSTAGPGNNSGQYPIVPSLVDPQSKLIHYTVTTTNGVLTVNRAPLSITADNRSRPYGSANPTLTGELVGLVNNDSITANYSTVATVTSPIGTYAIVPAAQGSQNKLTNYLVSITNGTLSVTQAPLSAVADNKSRSVGETNPIFTGTLTGVRNNDNITLSFTSTATSNSPAGTYPITPVLNNPDGRITNYSVTLTSGILTVIGSTVAACALPSTETGFIVVAGATSFVDISFTNPPAGSSLSATQTYRGWCIDYDIIINEYTPYAGRTFDPLMTQLPPKYTNLPMSKLHYILNNKRGTPHDVQNAIWAILGQQTDPPFTADFQAMTNAANSNGVNYVVTSNQLHAVILDPSSAIQPLIFEWQCTEPPIRLSDPRYGGGKMQFTLSTAPGTACRIERTTNFVNWSTVTTLTNATGNTNIVDSAISGVRNGFYRARKL